MTPLSYLNYMYITKTFGDDIFNDSFNLRNIVIADCKISTIFRMVNG